jgi:Glycosyltransferase family 29 (sialyltransferase)
MLKSQSDSVTGRPVGQPPSASEYASVPVASRRFDQFDFREMFAGVRSVAIVGNAATVLEFDNGELIDSHDMIVRFNRAQTTGLESKIGRRTDLLVANENNALALAPSPAETLKPRCVLSFVLREPEFDIAPFRRWVGNDIPTLCALPPDVIGFEQTGRTRLLTQGSYALYFLLNSIRIERLFLTGFTMFGAGPGGARKYYEPKESRRAHGDYHDLDQEPRLFCEILASFRGELRVTEEVGGLLAHWVMVTSPMDVPRRMDRFRRSAGRRSFVPDSPTN